MPQGERRARLEQVARGRAAARPPDARDPRPGAGRGLVRPVRGRRPRRRRRQAARRRVPAGQAGDAQDQARAHRRLRRRRVPLAQERPGHACRIAAARPVRRRGPPPPRRRHRVVHVGQARRARGGAGAAAGERARGPPVARVGRVGLGRRRGRLRAAPARRDEPLEPRQGPVVGAAPGRARRGGRLRPPAGRPLPPRDDVRPLAARQAARRCRYDQLETSAPFELARIFGGE